MDIQRVDFDFENNIRSFENNQKKEIINKRLDKRIFFSSKPKNNKIEINNHVKEKNIPPFKNDLFAGVADQK